MPKLREQKAAEDKAKKEAEEERLSNECAFEFKKLKFHLEVDKNMPLIQEIDQPKFEMSRILPKFNPKMYPWQLREKVTIFLNKRYTTEFLVCKI